MTLTRWDRDRIRRENAAHRRASRIIEVGIWATIVAAAALMLWIAFKPGT